MTIRMSLEWYGSIRAMWFQRLGIEFPSTLMKAIVSRPSSYTEGLGPGWRYVFGGEDEIPRVKGRIDPSGGQPQAYQFKGFTTHEHVWWITMEAGDDEWRVVEVGFSALTEEEPEFFRRARELVNRLPQLEADTGSISVYHQWINRTSDPKDKARYLWSLFLLYDKLGLVSDAIDCVREAMAIVPKEENMALAAHILSGHAGQRILLDELI